MNHTGCKAKIARVIERPQKAINQIHPPVQKRRFLFSRFRYLYLTVPLLKLLVNIATNSSSQSGVRVEGRLLHTAIYTCTRAFSDCCFSPLTNSIPSWANPSPFGGGSGFLVFIQETEGGRVRGAGYQGTHNPHSRPCICITGTRRALCSSHLFNPTKPWRFRVSVIVLS